MTTTTITMLLMIVNTSTETALDCCKDFTYSDPCNPGRSHLAPQSVFLSIINWLPPFWNAEQVT